MAKSQFTLSDFKANIKANGVARNSRFEIMVHPPMSLYNLADPRDISIRCHTGAIPPMNIKVKDYVIGQGQIRKTPVGYEQGHQLPFSFYNDNRNRVYSWMYRWASLVKYSNAENDYRLNFYDEIIGHVEVRQLDEQNNILNAVILYEAYPINLETINLDSSEQNTAQLVKVNFAYRYARPINEVIAEENVRMAKNPSTIANGADANYLRSLSSGRSATSTKYTNSIASYDQGQDSTLIDVAIQSKGAGLTQSQLYANAVIAVDVATGKGQGVYEAQIAQWPTYVTHKNEALYSQNPYAISTSWGQMQGGYTYLNSQSSGFFAETAHANSLYAGVSNGLVPNDPLSLGISALKNIYNNVFMKQSSITSDYLDYQKKVNAALSTTNTAVMQ